MKNLLITTAALTALGGALTANASDWSIGVFAGKTNLDGLNGVCEEAYDALFDPALLPIINIPASSCSSDDSDAGGGVYIGYHFNDTWSVELGYADLGGFSSRNLDASGTISLFNINYGVSTTFVAGVVTVPLSDRLSLSGRLGVHDATIDFAIDTPLFRPLGDSVEADVEVYAGASLNYAFSDRFSAQLRYDNFDVELIGLGLEYRFR